MCVCVWERERELGLSYTLYNFNHYYTTQFLLLDVNSNSLFLITFSFYILHAYKISKWSKISKYVIYQMFKFQKKIFNSKTMHKIWIYRLNSKHLVSTKFNMRVKNIENI